MMKRRIATLAIGITGAGGLLLIPGSSSAARISHSAPVSDSPAAIPSAAGSNSSPACQAATRQLAADAAARAAGVADILARRSAGLARLVAHHASASQIARYNAQTGRLVFHYEQQTALRLFLDKQHVIKECVGPPSQ